MSDEIISADARSIEKALPAISDFSKKDKEKATSLENNTLKTMLNTMMASVGSGSYASQVQVFWRCLDRFQHTILPTNNEHSGVTFITRPYLNLSDTTLAQNRVLSPLLTPIITSPAHTIRCLMDTKYAQQPNRAIATPLFNPENPFMTPLCNGLTSLSGLPDPYIQTETSTPGFHNEDQTIAIGSDNMNRTYDLSLSFRDIQGGPIMAIFMVWYEYMRMVTKGLCTAHPEAIDQRFLDYTVSIYRFALDPTRQFITRYARLVGCFPKAVPYGSLLTLNEGETFINSAGRFTIPFVANKCIYDDYAVIADFNRLVRRFANLDGKSLNVLTDDGQLETSITEDGVYAPTPENNYRGLPYIVFTARGPRLLYIDPTKVKGRTGTS
jgi:hypothetical protein